MPSNNPTRLREIAAYLVLLLALLSIGESLRVVLEDRRQLSIVGSPGGWYSAKMVHIAESLHSLGVKPGEAVACVGYVACLEDQYWARLAGVRILTEIYDPDIPVPSFLRSLPDRSFDLSIVRGQGAVVLVGDFGRSRFSLADPALMGWQELSDTAFFAYQFDRPYLEYSVGAK